MFHDLYFVSSDVEIKFSLGQKQTVLYALLAGTIEFDAFLLIQHAGKSRNGISQTKSRAVSQEWYHLKSSES